MFDSLFNPYGKSAQKDGIIGYADAVLRLVDAGGPFAHYTEPAALVRANGRVLARNNAAAAIDGVFGRGGDLAGSVGKAVRTRRPIKSVLSVSCEDEATFTYEFTVLPLEADAALVLGRDISKEVSLQEALVDSRRRYKDLVELSSDFAWETGTDGAFVFVSPAGALGYPAEELVSRQPENILDGSVEHVGGSPFSARSPVTDVDVWCRHRDGSSVCLQTSAMAVLDQRGRWTGTRGICRNVTGARQREAAMALAETRNRLLARIVRSIRSEIDPAAMLEAAAPAAARALGGPFCRIYRFTERGGFEAAAEFGAPTIAAGLETSMLERLRTKSKAVTGIDFDSCVLCVPAIYQRAMNGAFLVARPRGEGAWDEETRTLAEDIAGQLAVAFEQMRNQARLEAPSRSD